MERPGSGSVAAALPRVIFTVPLAHRPGTPPIGSPTGRPSYDRTPPGSPPRDVAGSTGPAAEPQPTANPTATQGEAVNPPAQPRDTGLTAGGRRRATGFALATTPTSPSSLDPLRSPLSSRTALAGAAARNPAQALRHPRQTLQTMQNLRRRGEEDTAENRHFGCPPPNYSPVAPPAEHVQPPAVDEGNYIPLSTSTSTRIPEPSFQITGARRLKRARQIADLARNTATNRLPPELRTEINIMRGYADVLPRAAETIDRRMNPATAENRAYEPHRRSCQTSCILTPPAMDQGRSILIRNLNLVPPTSMRKRGSLPNNKEPKTKWRWKLGGRASICLSNRR